jgi:3-oxoacyl-[acyl-carrier-protein] synthase II
MGEIVENLGWKAPTMLLASACASGTDAIGSAFQRIRAGDAKFAIAGAADAAITPLIMGGLCSAGLTPEFNTYPEKASRPFDKYRCGGILSEGCGIVILEDMDYARVRGANIYGEILGYGTSGDAESDMPASGLYEAICRALSDANLHPSVIEAVSAHAPSDPVIDRVETNFLKKIFGKHAYKIPVSSIKSMIGNPLGCAGPFQLIAALLWFAKDIVTPTINYDFPDPECDLYYVPNVARNLRISIALLDVGGLGGTCSALICKRSEL